MKIIASGFTLFELLIVMGIGLILLVIGIPSYQHLLARNKTTTVVNQVMDAIHSARTEAVARGETVVFCGSGDGMHCDGDWQAGQLLALDQTQQVLRVYAGLRQGDRLWWQSSLGANNALKLAPTGFTAGQRGSFYYCPLADPTRYGAKIVVADSGRVRVETDPTELQADCT